MLELLDNQLFFVLALLITAGAVAELLTRFVTVAFPYLMRGLSKLRATNQLFWFFCTRYRHACRNHYGRGSADLLRDIIKINSLLLILYCI